MLSNKTLKLQLLSRLTSSNNNTLTKHNITSCLLFLCQLWLIKLSLSIFLLDSQAHHSFSSSIIHLDILFIRFLTNNLFNRLLHSRTPRRRRKINLSKMHIKNSNTVHKIITAKTSKIKQFGKSIRLRYADIFSKLARVR